MATWIAALIVGVAFAGRGGFYVEGPQVDTRSAAVEMARAAGDLGFRTKVVRRYARGEGWRFVFRVEGFDDAEAAGDAAVAVADVLGRGVSVYVSEGGEARVIEAVAPSEPPPAPETAEPPIEDVEALLARASEAHGGERHPVTTSEAVLFRFRRTLPDGLVVSHTVAVRGADLFLDVDVEAGSGADSRTWILGDRAWLSVDGGEPEPKDATWAREQLARFRPENVLAFPLGFGRALAERRELQLLDVDGVAVVDGTACYRLRYDGDRVTGPIALYLDTERLLTRRVASGAGLVQTFDDYREIAEGVLVPHRVVTTREEALMDDVEVLELDLSPEFPEAWFQPPEAP